VVEWKEPVLSDWILERKTTPNVTPFIASDKVFVVSESVDDVCRVLARVSRPNRAKASNASSRHSFLFLWQAATFSVIFSTRASGAGERCLTRMRYLRGTVADEITKQLRPVADLQSSSDRVFYEVPM
jgi:hypothetical protein